MIQVLTRYSAFSWEPLTCSPYVLTQADPHRVFPTGGMGEVPPKDKNLLISPTGKFSPIDSPTKFLSPHQMTIVIIQENFIFSSCTIFILTSYSLYTQVMLILILINVQYLQNVVFGFEKSSNDQNHSSSSSCHPNKKISLAKLPIPPPLNAIWKTVSRIKF